MAARTLNEIIDSTRQTFLENLTLQEIYGVDPAQSWASQFSLVSLETLLTYVFSYVVWVYEVIVHKKADDLLAAISAKKLFTVPWYSAVSKAFQLGDDLIYNEDTYEHAYEQFDESKQIIKFVAVRQRQIEGVAKLQLYVAKSGKVALSAPELEAFENYMLLVGAAGTHFQFISLPPDQLTLNLTVYYNPQVLNASGLKLSDGTNPVEQAINDYLDNIKYAGKFSRTKQTDAIQQADGVMDVVLGSVLLNGEANTDHEFESASGFYEAAVINVTYIRYAD